MSKRFRKGTYFATYFVPSWDAATKLLEEMHETVASSFGQGDDQWAGIDLYDPKASVTITYLNNTRDENARVRIDILIPVDGGVPHGYWLSPFFSESIDTYDADGAPELDGPCRWGIKFKTRKRRVA